MITVPELAADALGDFLGNYMRRRYGSSQNQLVEIVPSIARIALECIGNSDALYHNVEHTMLVTMAGHDILRGRALHNHMPAEDYAHIIIACLTHDIGYVRGVCRDDTQGRYVTGKGKETVELPEGATDASLTPYHIERGKLFVQPQVVFDFSSYKDAGGANRGDDFGLDIAHHPHFPQVDAQAGQLPGDIIAVAVLGAARQDFVADYQNCRSFGHRFLFGFAVRIIILPRHDHRTPIRDF